MIICLALLRRNIMAKRNTSLLTTIYHVSTKTLHLIHFDLQSIESDLNAVMFNFVT